MADLCGRYPIEVICALLGAPAADWPLFSRWAEGILRGLSFEINEHLPYVEMCMTEMGAYVDELVGRRRLEPGDDVLTELIAVEASGDVSARRSCGPWRG